MNNEFTPRLDLSFDEIHQKLEKAFSTSESWNCCGCISGILGVVGLIMAFDDGGAFAITCVFLFYILSVWLFITSSSGRSKKDFYKGILALIFTGETSLESIASSLKTNYLKVGEAVQDMIDKDILPKDSCKIVDDGQSVKFYVSDEEAERQQREWEAAHNNGSDELPQQQQQPRRPSTPPKYAGICKGCGATNPDNRSHCEYCGAPFDQIETNVNPNHVQPLVYTMNDYFATMKNQTKDSSRVTGVIKTNRDDS